MKEGKCWLRLPLGGGAWWRTRRNLGMRQQGLGVWVSGFGFRVLGVWYRVSCFGYRASGFGPAGKVVAESPVVDVYFSPAKDRRRAESLGF